MARRGRGEHQRVPHAFTYEQARLAGGLVAQTPALGLLMREP